MVDNDKHFCGRRTDADNITKKVSDVDKLEQQM